MLLDSSGPNYTTEIICPLHLNVRLNHFCKFSEKTKQLSSEQVLKCRAPSGASIGPVRDNTNHPFRSVTFLSSVLAINLTPNINTFTTKARRKFQLSRHFIRSKANYHYGKATQISLHLDSTCGALTHPDTGH